MKVIHIITGLSVGGAEMMLYKLLTQMNRNDYEPEVISLTDAGPIGDKISELGVPVQALGMRRGSIQPFAFIKLVNLLRRKKPDLVQTWMYHSDFVGGLATKFSGGIPIVWGIRQSNLDPDCNKRSTIWLAKACAKLSHWIPDKIICCSHASQKVHDSLGYENEKMIVIPNGFDLDAFQPDPNARKTVREELEISDDALLVGLVGRFDPQKDHQNFIKAAALIRKNNPSAHFLLCGNGITRENEKLMQWIRLADLANCFHLLGKRTDVPRLVSALDVATSSSLGEGFSNVVGEAMACAIPCVVTDVGDSALIVGEVGRVVPSGNPEAFAKSVNELLDMPDKVRHELGKKSRERVNEKFSIKKISEMYDAVYREVADV